MCSLPIYLKIILKFIPNVISQEIPNNKKNKYNFTALNAGKVEYSINADRLDVHLKKISEDIHVKCREIETHL